MPPDDGAATTSEPAGAAPYRLLRDVRLGRDVVIQAFTNLYGCAIGRGTRIGTFVEIQRGASIGSSCKVQSHTFVCEGVTIGDEVFVGHGVVFINDKYPRATNDAGQLQMEADWRLNRIVNENGASIGSGAVILGGVRVGAGAMIGAGALVAKDVAQGTTVAGNPARAFSAVHRGPAAGSP